MAVWPNTGRALSVLVRDKAALKLARCLELPSTELEDVAAVLIPTFVYVEDNLGGRAEKLALCGFGAAHATRLRGASPKNSAWKWSRCGRRWERPGRTTPGCWVSAVHRQEQLR